MSNAPVKINGTIYPRPSMDFLGRADLKKLQPIISRMQQGDIADAPYEAIGMLMPKLPEKQRDNLKWHELQKLLAVAGIGDKSVLAQGEADGDVLGEPEITLGESSASTAS